MDNLLKNLNPICEKAFDEALEACSLRRNYTLEIEHLLLKLIEIPSSDVQFILRYYELDIPAITHQLEAKVNKLQVGSDSKPVVSPHVRKMLEKSWVTASLKLGHTKIRSGVILLSLIDSDSFRGILLESCPLILRLSRALLKNDLDHLFALSSERKYHTEVKTTQEEDSIPKESLKALTKPVKIKEAPHLNYILDLAHKTSKGFEILKRAHCNNIIVVAPTKKERKTIIEGIIHKAQSDLTFRKLKEPWDNSLAILTAHTPHKKHILWFEEDRSRPLTHFTRELENFFASPIYQVILSCDQTAFDDLCLALPEIQLHCQPIIQNEASFTDACAILRIESQQLGKQYDLTIDEAAFEGIATLADRFIRGIPMPHKAVNLLDNTCSWVKSHNHNRDTFRVTLEDIIAYTHEHTGADEIVLRYALDGFMMTSLEDTFKETLVHQEKASKLLAQRLCGHPTNNQFFFCGPYGFGQEELAKALACALTGFTDQIMHIPLHLMTAKDFTAKILGFSKNFSPYGVISISNLELAKHETLSEFSDWLDRWNANECKATLILQSESDRKPLIDLWQRQTPTVQDLFQSESTSIQEDKMFWHEYETLGLQHLQKFLSERQLKNLTVIPFLPYSLSQYTDIIRINLRNCNELQEKDIQTIASFCRNEDIAFSKIPDTITEQVRELIKESRAI